MKRSLNRSLILFLAIFGLAATGTAQNVKIGVVDMQECLNKYYKTEAEVKKIQDLALEKNQALDARKADYEALTKRATDLDKVVVDTALGNEQRQQAANELQGLMKERVAKGREIAQAEQIARQDVLVARQNMEQTLVEELREVVDAKAAEAGIDLVLDKSFLPKANKVILVANKNVPDLTKAIIDQLNVNAPPGWTPAATPLETAPGAGAAPTTGAAPAVPPAP
jgi:Skp family chaperone for outer membrane proteins